jgi:mono/diheme cytochrome c family protein
MNHSFNRIPAMRIIASCLALVSMHAMAGPLDSVAAHDGFAHASSNSISAKQDVNDDGTRYRDGPSASRTLAQHAVLSTARDSSKGGFVRIAADAASDTPSFDQAQAAHGKALYSAACAKCHGAQLQGIAGPALQGPAFAPASNAHLTIGGVYTYMATNMPADKPGKMKDQDYADIMAFLLYSNGYRAGGAKMTADTVRASTTKLNAGPSH